MNALGNDELNDEGLDDKDHPIAGAVGLKQQLLGGLNSSFLLLCHNYWSDIDNDCEIKDHMLSGDDDSHESFNTDEEDIDKILDDDLDVIGILGWFELSEML